jgi:carboxymethylenebutenolidase
MVQFGASTRPRPQRSSFPLLLWASRCGIALIAYLCISMIATTIDIEAPADDHGEQAMATEHAHDRPGDTPASLARPKQPVTGSTVKYGTGVACTGYLATPVAEHSTAPTIIVIHEWWGLNDQIKSMADQFAGLGYVALAVDLFHQPAATDVKMARKYFGQAMERKDAHIEELKEAAAFLNIQTTSDKMGVIGWCLGRYRTIFH